MFIGRNSQHICARTHVTIARTCVHKAARATGRAPGVTAGAGCDVANAMIAFCNSRYVYVVRILAHSCLRIPNLLAYLIPRSTLSCFLSFPHPAHTSLNKS